MARFRVVTHALPVVAVLLLLGLLYLIPAVRTAVQQIDSSIEATCREYGGETEEACLQALLRILQSEEESFERKNQAVWVIGQLADPRALPHLGKLLTGEPCADPCRKDEAICQREVDKAIRWCKGEAWLMKSFRRLAGSQW